MTKDLFRIVLVILAIFIAFVGAVYLNAGPGVDPSFAGIDENRPLGTEAGYLMDDYQRATRGAGEILWNNFLGEHLSTGVHQTNIFAAADLTNDFVQAHMLSNNVIQSYHIVDGGVSTNKLNAQISAPLVLLYTDEATGTEYTNFATNLNLKAGATIAPGAYRYLFFEGDVLFSDTDTAAAVNATIGVRKWIDGANLKSFSWRTHSGGIQRHHIHFTHMATGGASTNETYYLAGNFSAAATGHKLQAYNFRVWGIP